jgi:serine/threonine protein phosphatase PrpC
MQLSFHSEPGWNHENQDAVLARAHPDDDQLLVCLLADGQGGQPGGKEAAHIAIETGWHEAMSRSPEQLKDRLTWCEIIAATDEAVCENDAAGFTTMIALCVAQNRIYGAAVSDSMALLVKAEETVNLTARQRKNPPIGSSAAFPSSFETVVKADENLLTISDGVWRYVSEEVIAEVARNESGQNLIKTLRFLQTNQNGGKLPDDFSVVLVEF